MSADGRDIGGRLTAQTDQLIAALVDDATLGAFEEFRAAVLNLDDVMRDRGIEERARFGTISGALSDVLYSIGIGEAS